MSNAVDQHGRKVGQVSRRLLSGSSLAALILLATALPAQAQNADRNWDANGTAVGTGGTGTWNLGNLNWSPSGDGVSGPYNLPWTNAALDNAIFGGTAGTVTLAAPITVHNLTFNVAGYTLTGNTLTLASVAPTIATNSGNTIIDSVVAGSAGLTKAGAGGLILNGVNSFTGDILLNLGSIYAGSDAALGNAANNIFTGAGATVRLSITGAGTNRTVTIGNAGTLILEGAGAGSALITGNGRVSVAASGVTMSNDASTYTGQTIFSGCNGVCSARFTSIGDLGQASSLGAPVTVLDGTIVFNQQSQYTDSIIYLGDGDSSNRNWDINGNGAIIRNQGTGTLTITGDVDVSTGSSFYAETANLELFGILSGGAYAFNGANGNVVTLGGANTFIGAASIGGLVKASVLADIGAVSSLGAGTNITLSTGSLSYTGTGSSSNRVWIANGAGGILNDGTGALNLSGAATFAVGGAADSLTLGGTFSGENIFSGAISGAGNLIGNGAGTWVLGGASDFTGSVTVNAGTLKAGTASAFGAATGFIVNGGTLDLGGYDLIAPSLTGSSGTVALGSANLTVATAADVVFAGSITGTGGLTKAGTGTLTLSGANSYTGATTVNGGTLALGFNNPGAPVTDIVSSASTLNMAGGSLRVFGTTQNNVQTFNGLNIVAGNNVIGAQSGSGSVTINFGAINRAGGLIDFALPVTGNFTTSNTSLGGWATINGTDYAKVVGGNIVAFTDADYTDQDDASLWTDGQYISDSDGDAESFSGTVASNVQLAGLQFTTFDPTTTVTIAPAATLGVDGTIIVAPSVGPNNQTITGGALTGGTGGSTLGVQQNGGGIFTIASTIVNNGGSTSFAKSGSGTVRLTGANSYAGGTTLSGGRLEVASLANGGVNSSIGASSADPANLRLENGTLAYIGGSDAVSDRGITLVNGGSERAIQVDGSRTVEFSGLVTSPDDAGLTKAGGGTLVLSNAANDYVGVTTITGAGSTLSVNTLSGGGTVSGIGAASSDSANIVMSNGGRLQYTGGTVAIDRGFTLEAGQGGIDVANAGTTLTVGGIATGAGSFFKDGAGTLVLSGANTYTGDTTVNAGVLRAGSAQAFGPGGRYITVNSGATLDLGGFDVGAAAVIGGGLIDLGGRTLTTGGGGGIFTGRITGTGGYTRIGGFTQTFSGCNNDYTGVTTIGGAVSIDCIANGGQASGIGASSAASSNLVFAGGTLAYTGASVSTDRGFSMTGNGALNVFNAGTTLEFLGNITGSGQISKDGAGTLLLSGVNNTTGNVRVINGTLQAGSATALRSGFMSLDNTAGVLLDLDGYDNSVLYLIGGGATGGNTTLGTATLTISSGGSAAAVYGGAISGSGGLIKNGGSFQQLSGCSSSYGGTTVINAGTLAVDCLGDGGANSSIGSSSSAASNLVINGGALRYVGTGGSTDRQFTLGASAASRLESWGTGAIAFTQAGPLTFASANTAQTLTLGGANTADNIFAAQIMNNGTGLTRLTKTDAGTWILTNPGSTYTGITTISGGVLGVDKLADGGLASSLGASSAAAANLVIGNGSTLRYTGAGDTTNRLFTLSSGVTFIESSGTGAVVFTDTGPVTLASNNQARTIALGGTNAGNNTLAGSIGNAGTGVTTLAKNDSGTWVLTGNHSYTGSTNINGGLLSIGSGTTTGSIASAIVNNFGTLAFNRSDSLTYAGSIVGTGALQQNGAGTTVLTGDNSYTGGTTISAGTLQLGNGGATGSIIGDVVDNGLLIFNRSNDLAFNGLISGSGAVTQDGAGTTTLAGINSYAGGTTINAGILKVSSDTNLGAAAGTLTFNGGTLQTTADMSSARSATLASTGTFLTDNATTFTLSGMISGPGSLTKSGDGRLILTTDNSYSGGTTIAAGQLQLGNGGTGGWITGDVLNNGSLVFNRSDNIGFSDLVSGAGSVVKNGAGIVTLTANNSYLGSTTINAGTMTINGGLQLAAGSVLNFEFGQADVAGGPLNDLINVGGNLQLDGTINVDVPVGGTFGGGIYRVFNYGGVLTDNGLTLGTMPFGSDVSVQTSVAGQVNLINAAGLALNFWDGDAGPKVNGLVDGGDGTWHIGGTDKNWTNAAGAVNAAYEDGAFAIFAGTGGTVTIDNGGGAVTASGLQFASDGYLVTGDALTLTDPQSVVRVGDGTATGAGFVTTIAAGLTGAAQLVKTDAGTLVLTGSNSYTGGTLISGGVLSAASDSFLGDVAGAVTIDGGTLQLTGASSANLRTYILGANGGAIDITSAATSNGVLNALSGSGGLTKLGAGTFVLHGDNSYTGGTTISAGTLQIGSAGTTGSIVGDVLNNGALTFDRSNAYTYAGSITGTGSLRVAGTGVTTLTGNSNYGGGTLINGLGGELRIADGAIVTSGGSTTLGRSKLSVDGANTVFSTAAIGSINLAGSGSAMVNVTNGGTLRLTAGGVDIRAVSPVSTQINVTGANSLADVSGGIRGSATFNGPFNMTVGAGGTLRTGGASQIGTATSTTPLSVAITGAGSNWTSTSSLLMTAGNFIVDQGGAASFTSATFGTAPGAAGLSVSGASSSFATTGDLVIGSGTGTGALTLTEDARVDVGGAFILADNAAATGILNIGGGEGLAAGAAGLFDAPTLHLGSATSRVNFNHTDPDYSLASAMSGAGAINQVAGVTSLTGDSSAFTGATAISGGSLYVNNALGGNVAVATGGTLGGIGTIGGNVTVADGAVLNPGALGTAPGALTINGNLDLASGSALNVSLGKANVVGGPLNDLVNVGGNLTLDGTLNVETAMGGSFDPGIYRVINYTGALTDNGLVIGTIPSPDFYVQTSVANQVNLVNTSGLTFRYWDGTGAKNDGVIDGGNGAWQHSTGNDNWVDDGSIPNAPFADSAFAVFMGVAGNVTVDGSLGTVETAGMQFLTDGYAISGDAISLTGTQAVIRVGDGTAAGVNTSARINSALTGAAQLVKSDLGTLILSGTNSYTGGTAINGGILQISDDANLGAAASALSFNGGTLRTTTDLTIGRAIDLTGAGTLLTDADTMLDLTNAVSGAGGLTKDGAGSLILSGANSYAGGTTVNAGALFVNGDQSAAAGLTGVASGATLGGTGTIGGDVVIADGATLNPGGVGGLPGTLNIGGNLSLGSGSTLAMQFGEANAVGGALNDLIEVGGDLVLDGTLDVTVPAGGEFGAGIYRVLNYGGALTNNGLSLGIMPGGSTATVQTSVAGQINLINTDGLALNFWDGAAGPKFNNAIDGGDGLWQNGTGNDNWTNAEGAVNAAYADGAFAIFAGTGGKVTIDNSLGQVSASGMQFAANGYTIEGGMLELTGPQAIIRVGDGSTAGAAFTATIASEVAGATQLVKTDAGTLILSGSNSYTGGTAIEGGTLAISADANLGDAAGAVSIGGGTLQTTASLSSDRVFALTGESTILTDRATTFTLAGALSGTGALTKAGAGTLLLTGDSSGYVAASNVAGGALAVDGTLGSAVTIAQAGRLEGTGRVGSIVNGGVVAPGRGGIGTLTVAGDYAGIGGTLAIEAVLGDDSSATSRLVVTGATSGNTQVNVTNRGGLGGLTVEGIKIIDVAGASNGTFALNGDYVFNGEQAVIAGAYGYRLYQGSTSSPTDGDWYLRSALVNPVDPDMPTPPLYQPGVPIYESYGANLQALNGLSTLQQRVGNRSWAAGANAEGSGIWGRMEGTRSRANAAVSTSMSDQDVNSWKMQLGADHVFAGTDKGERLVAGVTAYYGGSNSHVRSIFGNGSLKTDGYGLGATLTWYGLNGFYIDGQAQRSWYQSDLNSAILGKLARNNDGSGEAFSVEVGKRSAVGRNLSVTPQIQMAYSNVRFDRFADPADAVVAADKGDSLKSRWGISLDHQKDWDGGRSHIYGLVNLNYEWRDGTRTSVSGTPIDYANERLWGELGVGASVSWTKGITLYGEVSGNSPFKDFGESYTLKANAGVRIAF
ncbi:autotransporter-associated beta strand repeat-containing protein [Sphingobium sp. CR28]|uniref:autotransporter-associated beta strand repeat-containing protein n=1 Tax=Sphingobium sp. CR28 TaxID=3400272 RepID=UPI003FEE192D